MPAARRPSRAQSRARRVSAAVPGRFLSGVARDPSAGPEPRRAAPRLRPIRMRRVAQSAGALPVRRARAGARPVRVRPRARSDVRKKVAAAALVLDGRGHGSRQVGLERRARHQVSVGARIERGQCLFESARMPRRPQRASSDPSPRSCSTNAAQLCACTSTMTAAVSRLSCSHDRAEAGVSTHSSVTSCAIPCTDTRGHQGGVGGPARCGESSWRRTAPFCPLSVDCAQKCSARSPHEEADHGRIGDEALIV